MFEMKSPIIFLSLFLHLKITDTLAFSTHAPTNRIRTRSCLHASANGEEEVRVYDGVFSSEACEMIHYLAVEHYERTNDGSSIFTRPPHNDRPLTPIEHAIDSALIELGDNTKRVEYWSRDEYMNIDVHADIDEAMLEDEGVVRCPLVGHVLYLQVQTGLHGPTCVFPREQKGWDLREENEKDLVVVPAVEGRLLRFPGSAMHAVPNPPDRWLMSRKEERALREEEEEEAAKDEDDDDWDEDDDDEDDEEVERSVLLFNTWPDDEPAPWGVNGDVATGALPEGIEINEEDAAAYFESQEAEILREWEEEYGQSGEKVRCNPFDQWVPLNIQSISSGANENHIDVNVSLMGNKNRRMFPKRYAELKGPREEMSGALMQDSKVTGIKLQVQ